MISVPPVHCMNGIPVSKIGFGFKIYKREKVYIRLVSKKRENRYMGPKHENYSRRKQCCGSGSGSGSGPVQSGSGSGPLKLLKRILMDQNKILKVSMAFTLSKTVEIGSFLFAII
jgi:hypothetical protein